MRLEKNAATLTWHKTGNSVKLAVHRVIGDDFYFAPKAAFQEFVDGKKASVSFARLAGSHENDKETT